MSDDDDRGLPAPPAPAASFRGALGRRLTEEGPEPASPAHLWLWIGVSAAAGVVLLLVALLAS